MLAGMKKIAKIVVDISLDREFDYVIPGKLADAVKLGSRVNVPFGRSFAQGYVVGFCDDSTWPDLKSIDSLIGDRPLFGENMIALARWISSYYVSTFEQAIRTLLPCAVRRKNAGFKAQFIVYPVDNTPDLPTSPKHCLVMDLLKSSGPLPASEVAAKTGATLSVLRTMERRGLVEVRKENIHRDPFVDSIVLPTQPLKLFPEQEQAMARVKEVIDKPDHGTVLLHGVTGSGKTEIYLQSIQYVLDKGLGAIVLVPEISLTPQTVERFRARFGDLTAVLHSHLSDGERHDQWHRIFDGSAKIVVGARSALFAPVSKLGLIVVDEEHENTYKQSEAPRYNARDVAVLRGRMEKCAVLLGSASPSLESFYNARNGKYSLAVLRNRVDNQRMPVMRVVDMRREVDSEGRLRMLSSELVEAVRSRIDKGEQVILFLNRRGFSTSVVCPECGAVASCEQCSVTLTYHKSDETMRCHICGYTGSVPSRCPECGKRVLKYTGAGTQRVEAVVKAVFPSARVARVDMDTTRQKNSYEKVFGAFKSGNIDILIGTQMIAKGLHFPGVTLVGVVQADLSLYIPDFRAAERTFQLLVQVAGRAGRGDVPGEVIVQTFDPTHPAIQAARRLDYDGFVDQEIEARKELGYPPVSHMTGVIVSGKEEKNVSAIAEDIAKNLNAPANVIVSGPMPAPLARIKGSYRYQILMRSVSASAISGSLKNALKITKRPRNINIAVDVDLHSMM